MIHTLTIIGALIGSIGFTSASGWRSYVKGKRVDAAIAARTSPTAQIREQEDNTAGLEDFLATVDADYNDA